MRWPRLALALPGAALIGVLILGTMRFPAQNLRADRTTLEFAQATLGAAPPHAVLISQQDAHTAALWYYQIAEGVRRDVVVVDAGLVGEAWYNAAIAGQLGLPPRALDPLFDPTAVESLGRAVCRVTEQDFQPHFGLVCTD